ncbi:MAG: hypothetical protein GX969_03130 [Firmicutes bacterium]|nr:hypothetical protein [Bacillota bacterium]
MAKVAILIAELKRGLKNHLAYPVQAVCEVIMVISVAIVVPSLLEGSFPKGLLGFTIDKPEKIVALTTVFIALIGLQIVHRVVKEESDLGTLEQLYLAPFGLSSLIIFRFVADTIRIMPIILIVVGIVSRNQGISWTLVLIPTIVFPMNIGMLGIGFLLGSLTLIAKRTGFIPNLTSLALLPLALSPPNKLPQIIGVVGSVIPFAHGIRLIEIILGNAPFSTWKLGFWKLCVLSGLWVTLGILCFTKAESIARHKGLLGSY